MGKFKLNGKPITVVCNNCFKQITGYRDETGTIQYRCPKCGTMTISKVIGRRHIQYDMYAPQGQELIN